VTGPNRAMMDEREENLRMLRDSAAAIAPRGGDLARIRALRFTRPGFDRATWREICGMGWVGLRVPEENGGAGLGMGEACALAEELAAGLVPEPLAAASLAAASLPSSVLPRVLTGERIVLPAWQERPDTLSPGEATVLRDGRLEGRKLFIPMAAGADAFLVAVRDGLALVEADAPGVAVEVVETQDGCHLGTLVLTGAPATAVPGDLLGAIEDATLVTAAGLLGIMKRSFAMSLDYLRTRKQFGKPIGSFQVLQHRAADLLLQIALARASVESAAAVLDGGAPLAVRQAAVSRAKARASDAAMLVTRESIQFHGGIGYTDEYDVGLYLRKAMVLANTYGSAAFHRARFAAVSTEDEDV